MNKRDTSKLPIWKKIVSTILIFSLIFPLCGFKGETGGFLKGFVGEGIYEKCIPVTPIQDDGEDAKRTAAIGVITLFKTLGCSDNFIIAMLANFLRECGLEWRSWEWVGYSDQPRFNPADPVQNPDNNYWKEFAYTWSHKQYNPSKSSSGKGEIGFGLMQWTDHVNLSTGEYLAKGATELCQIGEDVNSCWQTDFKVQEVMILKYVHGRTQGGGKWLERGASEERSVEDWALDIAHYVEGCAAAYINKTLDFIPEAQQIFNDYSPSINPVQTDLNSIPWDDNKALYDLVGGVVLGNGCSTGLSADMSDLVNAAISMAYWEEQPNYPGHQKITFNNDSINNPSNGTEVYKQYNDEFLGEHGYGSCDRSVCTPVRASGTDSDYPTGATGNQLSYCQSHPEKWQEIATGYMRDLESELEPGDIIVMDGHTQIFVGNEAIKMQFPEARESYVWVSGSIATGGDLGHGPRIQQSYGDTRLYHAFRFIGTPTGNGDK